MDLSIKSKLKELVNHSIVYGLTSSLQSILGFVLLPILTSYYNPTEFGVYSIILLFSALSSTIFYLGASSALGRFYYEEDSEVYQKQIVSAAVLITICGAVLLIGLATIFGETISILLFNTPLYKLHIILSLSAVAFIFLMNTMTLILRYQKKSKMFMIVTLSGVLSNFVITYALVAHYKFGILAPIYGTFWSTGFCILYLFLSNIKLFSLKLNPLHFKQILVFGSQQAIIGLLFYLVTWVDQWIIKDLLPMSNVGIYSVGYKLGSVLNVILIIPFSMIWAPIRMQYSNNSNNIEFVKKVSSYIFIIGALLVLLAMFFGNDLISLFIQNVEYKSAFKIIPIIMLAILIFGFQNILDFGIYLEKKLYFYILIALAGILFKVSMNYWLIPHFGYMAAAYITLLTSLLSTGLIFIASTHYYKLELEWGRILYPFLALIVINYVLSFTDYFVTFAILKKSVSCLILFILIYKFWLNKNEIIHFRNLIKKIS